MGGLDHVLCDLLKFIPVWLKCGSIDDRAPESIWCPSFGNLAAAVLACLAALVHHNRLMVTSGLSVGDHDAVNVELCATRLLSLGLDNGGVGVGIPLVMQWLSLQVTGAVMLLNPANCMGASTPISTPTQALIVRSIYRSIQNNLESHGSTHNIGILNSLEDKYKPKGTAAKEAPLGHLNFMLLSNPVTMSLAVDVLACIGSTYLHLNGRENATGGVAGKGHLKGSACTVFSGSSLGGNSATRTRSSAHSRKADGGDVDFLSLPDIIKWLTERTVRDRILFSASISRFIGRLSSGNSKSVCAAATSEVTLGAITDIVSGCLCSEGGGAQDSVLLIALVALWTIVHSSEKAKAVVKSSDFSNYILGVDMARIGDSHDHQLISRALAALRELFVPLVTDDFAI